MVAVCFSEAVPLIYETELHYTPEDRIIILVRSTDLHIGFDRLHLVTIGYRRKYV